MSLSFCIITAGQRPELLQTVLSSIRAQNVPEYEIIVSGTHRREKGIVYVEAAEAASKGRLAELRNRAVSRARFEHIVILDDDIVLAPDWYEGLARYGREFDILTSQIRVPDGSRYWDHASIRGAEGNRILEDGEDDEHLYMTGGGGWIMRGAVARDVRWDESRGYYQEEDVDFSEGCRARGYRISHNHCMVVFHADGTYTCTGRVVARRKAGRKQDWLLPIFDRMTLGEVLRRVTRARAEGEFAEAADYLRMGIERGPCRLAYRLLWGAAERKLGGRLSDVSWHPLGYPPYLDALKRYGVPDEGRP